MNTINAFVCTIIIMLLIPAANFPVMEKIMTFFMKSTQSAKNYKVLYYSTLKTVKARREQGSSAEVNTVNYVPILYLCLKINILLVP